MTVSPADGELLEALGQIDGVADERVLQSLVGAEQRGGHLARRDADAESEDGAVPRVAH